MVDDASGHVGPGSRGEPGGEGNSSMETQSCFKGLPPGSHAGPRFLPAPAILAVARVGRSPAPVTRKATFSCFNWSRLQQKAKFTSDKIVTSNS